MVIVNRGGEEKERTRKERKNKMERERKNEERKELNDLNVFHALSMKKRFDEGERIERKGERGEKLREWVFERNAN